MSIRIVWWLKYFYTKEGNTIKNMIKFHHGLALPLQIPSTHFFFAQELKVILLWLAQKSLRNKKIFRVNNRIWWKEFVWCLDCFEHTYKIIYRTKHCKVRKKRYRTDHITKMLSRKMTSESYPNLRGSLWNLWIKVALPLSHKT